MCIVIDINVLSRVFNENNKDYAEYKAIKEWIDAGKGFLVYGGSTYKKELAGAYRFLKLVRQLKDVGKAIAINDLVVDTREAEILRKTKNTDCDDQHIIALLCRSNCDLLCSYDARSFKYIKDKDLYLSGKAKTKIYTSSRNQNLLVRKSPSALKNKEL